ncbi:UPF0234 protein [Trichinella pseudospiralis]
MYELTRPLVACTPCCSNHWKETKFSTFPNSPNEIRHTIPATTGVGQDLAKQVTPSAYISLLNITLIRTPVKKMQPTSTSDDLCQPKKP